MGVDQQLPLSGGRLKVDAFKAVMGLVFPYSLKHVGILHQKTLCGDVPHHLLVGNQVLLWVDELRIDDQSIAHVDDLYHFTGDEEIVTQQIDSLDGIDSPLIKCKWDLTGDTLVKQNVK